MINIKNFDSSLLKIGKKIIWEHWHLLYWIYHNERYWWLWKYSYCKSTVSDCWESRSIHLRKIGSKYLVFGWTDKNKEVLKKYTELLG